MVNNSLEIPMQIIEKFPKSFAYSKVNSSITNQNRSTDYPNPLEELKTGADS
jgi:hypothetical protein